MAETAAERRAKYDPVKRREYYLKTRELKGRSRSNKNRMLTDEDRSNVKNYEQLKKMGMTSKKLDNLNAKLKKLDNDVKTVIVQAIKGQIFPEDAKRRIAEIDAERLKVRDDIWNETNNLKAKAYAKATAKDWVDFGKHLINPNSKDKTHFERQGKFIDGTLSTMMRKDRAAS